MAVNIRNELVYPSLDDIIGIHGDIVSEDNSADRGCINIGNVDFSLDYIEHGHFGECPDTIHEKAVHLMRLLAANHSFVDGNKRTALNTTWVFYFLNGYHFDYGEEIKAILKLYAVMERMVATPEVCKYFEDITTPIENTDAVSEDVRELFRKQRNIAEKIKQAEHMLADDEQTNTTEEIIALIQDIINNLRSVGETIESYDIDDTDLFWEILSEQIDWLETIVDDLAEMQNSED